MSKKLLSTLLLFAIGAGFGLFTLNRFLSGDLALGFIYLIPTVAAFGALIMLPFRAAP